MQPLLRCWGERLSDAIAPIEVMNGMTPGGDDGPSSKNDSILRDLVSVDDLFRWCFERRCVCFLELTTFKVVVCARTSVDTPK